MLKKDFFSSIMWELKTKALGNWSFCFKMLPLPSFLPLLRFAEKEKSSDKILLLKAQKIFKKFNQLYNIQRVHLTLTPPWQNGNFSCSKCEVGNVFLGKISLWQLGKWKYVKPVVNHTFLTRKISIFLREKGAKLKWTRCTYNVFNGRNKKIFKMKDLKLLKRFGNFWSKLVTASEKICKSWDLVRDLKISKLFGNWIIIG